LKKQEEEPERNDHCVSNPWREAIEGIPVFSGDITCNEFPILGGRLLKKFRPIMGIVAISFQSLEGGY